MCTKTYNFVAFGCMKIPNFVRGGKKFPFGADGREENEGGAGLGVKKGRGIAPFRQDRRTTMTVSVTQEQMRQNVFHHTLTVPLSSGQKNRPPVFQKNRPPVFPCLQKNRPLSFANRPLVFYFPLVATISG